MVCGLTLLQTNNVFGLDDQIRLKVDEINGTNEIKIVSGAKQNVAIFLRGNRLWFVFDKFFKLNINDDSERETSILKGFRQLEADKNSTIAYIEVVNHSDFEFTTYKTDDDLVVRIAPYDNSILSSEIASPREILKSIETSGNKVDVQLFTKTRNIITFTDPFLGEKLFVIPENECVRNNNHNFVDFNVLASLTGVVIETLNDSVVLNLHNKWLQISSKSYLNISNFAEYNKAQMSFERLFKDDNDTILDLRSYKVSKGDFNRRLNDIYSVITNSYDYTLKGDNYMNLAIFFLANQWYVEAKGTLELVKKYSDVIERDYQARLIIGVIYFLCGDINESYDMLNSINLNNVDLKQRSEIRFWVGLSEVAYRLQNKETKDVEYLDYLTKRLIKRIVNNKKGFISRYNSDIFNHVAFKLIEYSSHLKRYDVMSGAISVMSTKKLEGKDQRLLNYYTGKLFLEEEDVKSATAKFRACADDPADRYVYSRCNFELANLMRKTSQINQIKYINSLQSISTTWRGDAFEVDVLEKLAETYYEMQDIPNAIRVWKIISNAYPQSYSGFLAVTKASKSFINYFKTSNDSKLAKLSFFYEFKDLIPLGDEGDEIILQTASYMVDLDLLDQAVKVMEYQVKNRLFGIVREKVVNELINIYCSMKNWSAAEKLVDDETEFPFNMTNPILAERKYLYANAIIDGGQYFDGVALLYGDGSRKADELRSKAFFALNEWDNFNDNSEPYLYSIRYDKNFSLSDDDTKKILKQNISYFNGKQMRLFNNLFLDFKPRLKKGEKNSERNKLFYQIANDLNSGDFTSNEQKQENVKSLIKQIAGSV